MVVLGFWRTFAKTPRFDPATAKLRTRQTEQIERIVVRYFVDTNLCVDK